MLEKVISSFGPSQTRERSLVLESRSTIFDLEETEPKHAKRVEQTLL